MALCYRYNENKKYIGSEEMHKDPLESELQGKDIWLLPADCTLIEPPEEKEGFDIVWNGDAWEYKELKKDPEPHVPTEDELKAQVRSVRDKYMQTTQNRIDRYRNQKELGIETTDAEEVFKQLLEYTQYLRDYPSGENWWESKPLKFDECNEPKEPDPSETQEEAGI